MFNSISNVALAGNTWLNVRLPNGDLPRRADGSYLYWKTDKEGKLIPIRKIGKRLPIFMDNKVPYNRGKNFYEQQQ